MGGYIRTSRVLMHLGALAMRLWAFSGFMLFVCFILYYLYGGLLAFFLLLFATTGNVCRSIIFYHNCRTIASLKCSYYNLIIRQALLI